MPGDPLKKVRPGDPLRIPAGAFNAFVEAAIAEQKRRHGIARSIKPHGFESVGLVLIKNNSGADRDHFDVLGIDGPIFTPAEGLDSFKNDRAFKGITPTTADHLGKFVILLEPLATGKIGSAVAAGVCPVRVNVTDELHEYADVANGQAGYLASGETGAARILWAESGTGLKWAKIRIGAGAGGDLALYAKITVVPTSGDPTHGHANPCGKTGTGVDTGTTLTLFHRWKHGLAAGEVSPIPHYAVDDILAYVDIGDHEGIILGDWIFPKAIAAQYKPLWYDANGRLTADWLRFH